MLAPNQTLQGEPLSLWIPDMPVETYARQMSRSGVWGGGVELAVLSTLLRRPILVYAQTNQSQASRIAEFLPSDVPSSERLAPTCILYVGRAHYMQLMQAE